MVNEFKSDKPAKAKKTFENIKKGAKEIGGRVAGGATSLAKKGYESYKAYTSPEAKQTRLDKEEKMMARQVRMAEQKARIRSLQQRGGGGRSFLGGFQGIDVGGVLGGGGTSNGNFGGGMDISGGLGSGFDMIMGSQPRAPSRTVVRYRKATVRRRAPSQRAFDPFSQF